MAISTNTGFLIGSKAPIDERLVFATIADMKAYDTNLIPDVYLAVNKEDGQLYIYNVDNDEDPTTGKWKVLEGGASSGGLNYKGAVDNYSELPTDAAAGDMYKVNAKTVDTSTVVDGHNYFCSQVGVPAELYVKFPALDTDTYRAKINTLAETYQYFMANTYNNWILVGFSNTPFGLIVSAAANLTTGYLVADGATSPEYFAVKSTTGVEDIVLYYENGTQTYEGVTYRRMLFSDDGSRDKVMSYSRSFIKDKTYILSNFNTCYQDAGLDEPTVYIKPLPSTILDKTEAFTTHSNWMLVAGVDEGSASSQQLSEGDGISITVEDSIKTIGVKYDDDTIKINDEGKLYSTSAGALIYRGSVNTYDQLPANPGAGDMYTVSYKEVGGEQVADGHNYFVGEKDSIDLLDEYYTIYPGFRQYPHDELVADFKNYDHFLIGGHSGIGHTWCIFSDNPMILAWDSSLSGTSDYTITRLLLLKDNEGAVFVGTNYKGDNKVFTTQLEKTTDEYVINGNTYVAYIPKSILPSMSSWSAYIEMLTSEDDTYKERLHSSYQPYLYDITTGTTSARAYVEDTPEVIKIVGDWTLVAGVDNGGSGEGSTFTNTNPSTVAVGGIAKGTTFDNVSFAEFAQMLLYPYVPFNITGFTTSEAAGNYEYGTTIHVTKGTPTFTLGSKPITGMTITSADGQMLYSTDSVTSGTEVTFTTSISIDLKNATSIDCNLLDGTTTLSKTVTYTPVFSIYYAVSDSNTTVPTSGTKGNDTNITVSDNQYIWFFSKDAKSQIQQYANGQWNDIDTFDKGTVEFTLSSGVTYTYHAYVGPELMTSTEKYKIV